MSHKEASKLTGSEVIVEYLIKGGIPYIFGINGWAVMNHQ